jgi:hypothetical protein
VGFLLKRFQVKWQVQQNNIVNGSTMKLKGLIILIHGYTVSVKQHNSSVHNLPNLKVCDIYSFDHTKFLYNIKLNRPAMHQNFLTNNFNCVTEN